MRVLLRCWWLQVRLILTQKDDFHQTPLSLAARLGHEGIVKVLVATGKADINHKGPFGKTALSYARDRGDKNIFKMLTLALDAASLPLE